MSELTPRVMERQRSLAEEQDAKLKGAKAEVLGGSLLARLQFHMELQVISCTSSTDGSAVRMG